MSTPEFKQRKINGTLKSLDPKGPEAMALADRTAERWTKAGPIDARTLKSLRVMVAWRRFSDRKVMVSEASHVQM